MSDALRDAVELMARLRGPDGCPWDREQTFDSIKRHTLEETYEVFDAIERRAWPELKDELGDLLLQVLFYAQMAADAGYFTIDDVAVGLNAKLVRRHPHIFGDGMAETASDVNRNWEAVKKQEKAARGESEGLLMDGVPRHVPAMMEATKLGAKAAKVGFDWPSVEGLYEKMAEELAELKVETAADRVEDEFGDVLFTAMNLGRRLRVDPEFALRRANAKFRRRFGAMEEMVGAEGLMAASEGKLEELWLAAKAVRPDKNPG